VSESTLTLVILSPLDISVKLLKCIHLRIPIGPKEVPHSQQSTLPLNCKMMLWYIKSVHWNQQHRSQRGIQRLGAFFLSFEKCENKVNQKKWIAMMKKANLLFCIVHSIDTCDASRLVVLSAVSGEEQHRKCGWWWWLNGYHITKKWNEMMVWNFVVVSDSMFTVQK